MNAIQVTIEITIGKEGKYSNNPKDSGGATCWGITEKVARKHGYEGEMKDLPRELAVTIYTQTFYLAPRFDSIFQLSRSIGAEVFDSGVNCGPATSSRWLQKCLNVLNHGNKDWENVEVTGLVNASTLLALQAFLKMRGAKGEMVLLRMLNSMQGAYYIGLAEQRVKDEEFIFGWFLNRVVI
jgi:lysozyme family protein